MKVVLKIQQLTFVSGAARFRKLGKLIQYGGWWQQGW